ncbi:MAG: bifunctional salicylyl-CoA 5-hydroxylase/oxidoreductase [Planctomycetaceae bacterium]|nr:bifunctional salicylyl-CoA 5-hydroxylase/oxidoreductase [Planctomycetaceae bacterium]
MKKVNVIGGGPAGLYFGVLMKKLDPKVEIEIFERNDADDTFGWGIVFSDETLGNLQTADPESFKRITDHFIYWDSIDIVYGGTVVKSKGHGFCGLSRKTFLNILQARARELGVKIHFNTDVQDIEKLRDADLLVAADGVNSKIREKYAATFKPSIDWRKCKFCWLGTTLPLPSFTFIFRENEHGLFQIHAYQFEKGKSTFIAECREETWKAAGLDKADETGTVTYLEKLFAPDLKGHKLLTNRSIWRTFPTISNEKWHHENVVLVGDGCHTAHFSIGSGTKLAMEDIIALVETFREHGTDKLQHSLAIYEERRRPDVIRAQKAAQISLEWFENSKRYMSLPPKQLAFTLLARTKAITWDNLSVRDPESMREYAHWYGEHCSNPPVKDGRAPMFTPFKLRDMQLTNRVVVSPMCMYCADDGLIGDWHLVHLGSRALGGAGLIVTEMTCVSREGRITPGCAGMYKPEHAAAWKRVVDFVHGNSPAKICVQLGHSGRKGSTKLLWEGMDEPLESGNWPIMSASPIPYTPKNQTPREMTRADMDKVRDDFVRAAKAAEQAGFDMLEVHMAHGYLLASFISPLTNKRKDNYGGSLENRMRFPLEVFDAVREIWPKRKPMSARISATDWVDDGLSGEDSVEIARMLKDRGCDLVDVSAGQTTTDAKPNYGRMFQVPFSDRIRHEVGIATMAVGNIQNADQINTVLAAGRADLCALARPHLKDPNVTLHAAEKYGFFDQWWPDQYTTVKPRKK